VRAQHADLDAVEALAARVDPRCELAAAGTFGDGRIVHVAPANADELVRLRSDLLALLPGDAIDPLAERRPWNPHVTLAYAVPEPHRAAAFELVAAALPLVGRWAQVQAWDLDVRPTRLVHAAPIGRDVDASSG
jgi:2'-5' RNA ligase